MAKRIKRIMANLNGCFTTGGNEVKRKFFNYV
jgi:hypothetical protein